MIWLSLCTLLWLAWKRREGQGRRDRHSLGATGWSEQLDGFGSRMKFKQASNAQGNQSKAKKSVAPYAVIQAQRGLPGQQQPSQHQNRHRRRLSSMPALNNVMFEQNGNMTTSYTSGKKAAATSFRQPHNPVNLFEY